MKDVHRRGALRTVLALVAMLLAATGGAAEPLPRLGVAVDATTVSGLSAGGYMAVQFHVAHSSIVKGAGVLAGGPYFCARGNLWTAYYDCMTPASPEALPDVQELATVAGDLARAGRVDPVGNLAHARVWLFSGTRDQTVSPAIVDALRRFYLRFVPAAGIEMVTGVAAGHGMVTEDAGVSCGTTDSPYINDCDYDAAGKLLAWLLGPLTVPDGRASGKLVKFDQRELADGDAYSLSMAEEGYAYIPDSCARERCRVHVAFHGCRQNAAAIGERFVREAGYNRWAAANHLVVLYPQTVERNGWGGSFWRWNFVYNPRACWDWWGYTGTWYHTRDGGQIRAVKAMIDRLAQPSQ